MAFPNLASSNRLPGVLLAIALAAPDTMFAQSLEDVLARMDKASVGFRGITATVKKVTYTSIIKDLTEETGKMSLYRPKLNDLRMLVQFEGQDPRSVSFAGKKLQIYYPKMQLIQEYDLGKQSSLLDQFLLLGFGTPGSELQKKYSVRLLGAETLGSSRTFHLELEPKDEEARAHVRQVDLWIGEAEGQPLQQKIYQASKDYVQITYKDLKINPPSLNDSSVKLNAPKGTKIERPQR